MAVYDTETETRTTESTFHMNNLDTICQNLERQGFFAAVHRRAGCFEAVLWNNVTAPHFLPAGFGLTSLDAVQNAVAARDQAIEGGRCVVK